MTELTFWSLDRRFGLHVGSPQVRTLLSECAAAGSVETGGLLIGTYSPRHDCAIVTIVCGASADSRAGRSWFYRGTVGVQQILDRYWQRREAFYLGEWHFHPNAGPSPSDTDQRSITRIADSKLYNCPEPVLLIVGGDPRERWTAWAAVFPRGAAVVPLLEDSRD